MQSKLPNSILVLVPLALLSLVSCGTSGPKDSRIHAQRPFISQDTYTTPDKVVTVEAGGAVAAGRETETPIYLRYGLGPQSEFFLGTSPYTSVDYNGQQPDGSGWGDSYIGFRHRMRERDMYSPAYGFQVQTKLPSASTSRGLGSGEIDWFGALMANQMYNGFDTTAFYQLGILGEQLAPDTNIEHTLAVQTRREVSTVATAFAEFAMVLEPEIDRTETTIMGGVSFLLNPLTAIDIGVRLGIGDDANSFQVLFGVSRALGMIFFPEDEARASVRR